MRAPGVAAIVGAAVIVAAGAGWAVGHFSSSRAQSVVYSAAIPSPTITAAPATTVVPPTTTTVPPPTTTTVATATVPDAVSLSMAAATPFGGEHALTVAGFTYQVEKTDSGACWFNGISGRE